VTLPPDLESPGHVLRTTASIRYVAEPKHVREVSLIGTSDFEFWSDYLKPEGLEPVRCGGAAQVVVVAAEMVYLGVRFTEVSFSVRASLAHDSNSTGLRLLHAFTSSRVFAWCERALFAAPYSHGECHVSIRSPLSIRVKAQSGRVANAEMSAQERAAIRAGDERWEAPVFLPPRGTASDQRLFFGRLRGHTVVYPFSGDDCFAIEPSARGGILRPIADSRFSPQEWVVRADATHGKSKTYRREDVFTHDRAA
jgi:hypothetical protein